MCKRLLCTLFLNLIDFDGPSSKCQISDYNHHRKLKLGSIELYGNTKWYAKRTINLKEPSLRYSRSKVLRFFRDTLYIYIARTTIKLNNFVSFMNILPPLSGGKGGFWSLNPFFHSFLIKEGNPPPLKFF